MRTIGVSVFAAFLAACAPAAPPAAPASTSARLDTREPSAGIVDRDWGVISSQRFLLAVPVPDAAAWKVDDRTGRWLFAVHTPSQSTLFLRSWHEGAVVDHRACEQAARSYRHDLFGRDEAELQDRREIGAPSGFDTEVGFVVRRESGVLQAIAAASGASVRRCIAVVFVTRVEGANSERSAADRLLFATTRILSRIESRTIEDRVQPRAR